MSTSLEILNKVVGQASAVAVDPAVQKMARLALSRTLPNTAVLLANFTGPASTTLAAPAGLTITNGMGFNNGAAVVGGRTYQFNAMLPCTVNGTSGINVTGDGGTATFSMFAGVGEASTASTTATLVTTTAGGSMVTGATAYTYIVLAGTFTASASGSFNIRIATNTGTATAPILLAGSSLSITEIPQQ